LLVAASGGLRNCAALPDCLLALLIEAASGSLWNCTALDGRAMNAAEATLLTVANSTTTAAVMVEEEKK
jgi:hypothetical protein